MGKTILKALEDKLEADAPLVALLPGGIWTRDIQPYAPNAPGATAAAYDDKGRIKRCLSITGAPISSASQTGPEGTYFEFPELYLRCLPHESEKDLAENAIHEIERVLRDAVLAGKWGEGLVLRLGGHIGPFDDQIITNCVLYMVRIQVDSVWK